MSEIHRNQRSGSDEERGEGGLTSRLVEGTLNIFKIKQVLNQNDHDESDEICCPLLSLKFWKRYFDVSQSDIRRRICSSLFLTPPFEKVSEGRPDLYGPFWIYTTIIAVLSISANICSYLNTRYNFKFVPVAAGLIYGVGIITPSILWAVIKLLFKVKIKLIQTICLFGYSETCFAFISCLSMIPNTTVQWGLLGYGFALSTIFLFRNAKREMQDLQEGQKYIVFGIVMGCQLILCFTFKFYFFSLTKLKNL